MSEDVELIEAEKLIADLEKKDKENKTPPDEAENYDIAEDQEDLDKLPEKERKKYDMDEVEVKETDYESF